MGVTFLAKPFAKRFYKSKAWERARELAMSREVTLPDGRICPPFMCERCFGLGKLTPAKIVHHKTHLSEENIGDPLVTLGLDNLMRVCKDCHDEIHYADINKSAYTPRVAFDEDGRVIPIV